MKKVPGKSLGLSIAGGKGSEMGDIPLIIASITPGSQADEVKHLKVCGITILSFFLSFFLVHQNLNICPPSLVHFGALTKPNRVNMFLVGVRQNPLLVLSQEPNFIKMFSRKYYLSEQKMRFTN